MDDFTIYSTGIFYMSVCSTLERGQVEARANTESPSGTTNGWRVADEPFRTGAANPCPCDQHPDSHKHWLLAC
jgi:hypothetical protein